LKFHRDHDSISNINIREPASLRGNLEDSLNTKFNWSDKFIQQFQQRKRTEDQIVGCRSKINEEIDGVKFTHPKTIAEFVPKQKCG